jgi:hypothetical protein
MTESEAIKKEKEAINYLESRGYGVSNLWHVDDVRSFDNSVTTEDAKTILKNALSNEPVLDDISLLIIEEVELMNYNKQ